MKNIAHVQASFHLMFETEMGEEEFQNTFDQTTISDSKVSITLPNGVTYTALLSDLLSWNKVDFEVSEAYERLVDRKKVTELGISDQIAI